MNEFDSPNYTEYTYDKKAEGKALFLKWLLIFAYAAFVIAFFLVCYVTRIIPLFAICPLITWIIVFFTWRLVSYDVYFTFEHGNMELGRVRVTRRGSQRKPKLTIQVKGARLIAPLDLVREREEFKKVKIRHDYSSYRASSNLAVIIFEGNRGDEAVIFENTPKLAKLLVRYCDRAEGFNRANAGETDR